MWYEWKFRIKNIPVNELHKTWQQHIVNWLLAFATKTLNGKYDYMLPELSVEKYFNERQADIDKSNSLSVYLSKTQKFWIILNRLL